MGLRFPIHLSLCEEGGKEHAESREDNSLQEPEQRGCAEPRNDWEDVAELQQRDDRQAIAHVGHHGVAPDELERFAEPSDVIMVACDGEEEQGDECQSSGDKKVAERDVVLAYATLTGFDEQAHGKHVEAAEAEFAPIGPLPVFAAHEPTEHR